MKKRTICIATGTRSEWGLLRPLAKAISDDKSFNLVIFATGTHFCQEFGNTYTEIINDGFEITERIDIQLYAESPAAVSKTLGLTVIGFADAFARHSIDLLIVMGDRYEMLGVCIAAMNAKIPIAHLAGGDLTAGAIDDAIRHCITKLSYLHFTSCDASRKRVIQLGESPERVFAVGELGIDNIRELTLMGKKELSESLKFDIATSKYGIIAFHPETLGLDDLKQQLQAILSALNEYPDLKFIATKSNADEGGTFINRIFEEHAKVMNNFCLTPSLGNLRYLSLLKHSSFVLGNSSSGIVEAPYFEVPTINIGSRQQGRIQSKSIINCEFNKESIVRAIECALSEEFRAEIHAQDCPYGDGHASENIVAVLHDWLDNERIDLKKEFYDL